MTISIREARDSDFFPWLSLYEGYAADRGVELTEQRALQLWTWLSDPGHSESALVALDDSGDVVGFVHFHAFPRPLLGETGVFVDALAAREDSAAQALFDAVRAAAAGQGATVIRWTQAEGEALSPVLSGAVGEPSTSAVFELQTAPQPA